VIKVLFYLVVFFSIITVTSCGGDGDCVQKDWVGTWSGTFVDEAGDQVTTVAMITAVGTDQIQFSSDGVDYDPVTISGCNFEIDQTVESFLGDLGAKIDANLDGDQIDMDVEATLFGITTSHNVVLNRQ